MFLDQRLGRLCDHPGGIVGSAKCAGRDPGPVQEQGELRGERSRMTQLRLPRECSEAIAHLQLVAHGDPAAGVLHLGKRHRRALKHAAETLGAGREVVGSLEQDEKLPPGVGAFSIAALAQLQNSASARSR